MDADLPVHVPISRPQEIWPSSTKVCVSCCQVVEIAEKREPVILGVHSDSPKPTSHTYNTCKSRHHVNFPVMPPVTPPPALERRALVHFSIPVNESGNTRIVRSLGVKTVTAVSLIISYATCSSITFQHVCARVRELRRCPCRLVRAQSVVSS